MLPPTAAKPHRFEVALGGGTARAFAHVGVLKQEYARTFYDLHVEGQQIVLVNVWDAGSVRNEQLDRTRAA